MRSTILTLGTAALLVLGSSAQASAQVRVQGVDVSEYQGNIDWAAAKAAGIGFGFTRVSDGLGHRDGTFQQNWNGMAANGVVRGPYQFFRPGEDPVAQADLLVSIVGTLGAGDLSPVLDLEVTDGVGAATIVAQVQAWCDRIKARTGRTATIYTAAGFFNPLHGNLSAETLWVANWFVGSPEIPSGWSNWVFWQYDDNGRVAGIPATVDQDVFNGSLADLLAYAHGGPKPGGSGGGGASGAEPVLTYGTRGAAVSRLQQLLTAKGDSTGGVDGVFGAKTLAAVRAFQGSHGLSVDGVVGPHTWAALLASGGGSTGGGAVASHPTLQEGSSGSAVVELQKDLAAKGFSPGAADGAFGPHTAAEVRAFQASRGLSVDGVAGPMTWAALTR
jgi:GH25 family lysozyme M1 (1,4-beta-N-acetylmuramidase)/peptidoglycan hydrolase-like protein with peptidoglycan-binding domain